MRRQFLTLLEVLIVIAILSAAAGALGLRLQKRIESKRFATALEHVHSRFVTCRRLALNMQADWRLTLERRKDGWGLRSFCLENGELAPLPFLKLSSFDLLFQGEPVGAISFDFTSTGEVYPKGKLSFFSKKNAPPVLWELPYLFSLEEGKELGPVHPKELKNF